MYIVHSLNNDPNLGVFYSKCKYAGANSSWLTTDLTPYIYQWQVTFKAGGDFKFDCGIHILVDTTKRIQTPATIPLGIEKNNYKYNATRTIRKVNPIPLIRTAYSKVCLSRINLICGPI